MLEVLDLQIAFGERKVLKGVNFKLHSGTITTLLGANGSGKTTLFNIITGFLKPNKGKIILNGLELKKKSPAKRVKLGITRTFQDLRIIKELTVKENIILSLKNNPGENIFKAILPKFIWNHKEHELEQRAENIIKEIFLNEVKDNLASDISYGQQKILTLGCVIANEPNIMLLDEPVAGVNVSIQEKIIQIIKSIKESGKTILMIEHNSDFINAVSDNILFLDKGKINKYDNYSEFKEKIVLGNSEYF